MSDIGAPVAFELARRPPSQRTAGLISGISGYREMARGRFCQREAAPLAVPLIISLGTPFTIALGHDPDAADRQHSFAAGLYAGAVYIESDGGAECVQVDFTPLGAYRFFGGAVVDPDALHAKATAAGARIEMGLHTQIMAAAISPAGIRKAISGVLAPTGRS